jgi:hypothetical protein
MKPPGVYIIGQAPFRPKDIKMKIRTGTKEFDAQYPIGAGVHVIPADNRDDVKLLISICGFGKAFVRALAEWAIRSAESGNLDPTETAILLFRFQVRNFSGLAPISITVSNDVNDGKGVFIFFDEDHRDRATAFADGLVKQMAVEAANNK